MSHETALDYQEIQNRTFRLTEHKPPLTYNIDGEKNPITIRYSIDFKLRGKYQRLLACSTMEEIKSHWDNPDRLEVITNATLTAIGIIDGLLKERIF